MFFVRVIGRSVTRRESLTGEGGIRAGIVVSGAVWAGPIGLESKLRPSRAKTMGCVEVPTGGRLTAERNRLQIADHFSENFEVRISPSQRYPDVSDGHANLSADFEQLESDRLALRTRQIGVL